MTSEETPIAARLHAIAEEALRRAQPIFDAARALDERAAYLRGRMRARQMGMSEFMGERLDHAASCDRNPKGEKPQALSAKHESAVAATSGETPQPSDLSTDKDG